MKANKHFKTVSRIMFAVLIPIILLGFLFALHKSKKNATKITVAVPYNEYVQNFDTNYYSNWLREKSGYDIEFVTISDGYEEEYLSTMLYKAGIIKSDRVVEDIRPNTTTEAKGR